MTIESSTVQRELLLFTRRGLLANHEAAQVLEVLGGDFPFAEAMGSAESVHVHVTVEDVAALPDQDVLGAASQASGNDVERKFAFASGLNVVFASEPTAQDELIPGAENRRKPYVDHLGVDLREVNEATEAVFARIPEVAHEGGWRHVFQAGPVRCCHVEMGPKHWVYPPEGVAGTRRPVEFAFGDLKASEEYLGCDYRPIDPGHPLAGMAGSLGSCEGTTATGGPVRPLKIHIFEECSCNTSPSLTLLEFFRDRYGSQVDVRAFDLAELQGTGFGVLPALVVDGSLRTLGWLPSPMEATAVVEEPQQGGLPQRRPTSAASSSGCCTDDACC